MRVAIERQLKLGQPDISEIKIDLNSRDEIPKILIGLQSIYSNDSLIAEIFEILQKLTPKKVSNKLGRKGMSYWSILVLGVLRLSCNWNYDQLREIVNNHRTIREMIGLSTLIDWDVTFGLQTLRDNLTCFTQEILEELNVKIVQHGHGLFGRDEEILARCDSSVVKTNVHYPTDINLLLDAMRKVITLVARVCEQVQITDWRQSQHNFKKLKKLYRKAQCLKHSTANDPKKKKARLNLIKEAYEAYLDQAEKFLKKSESTLRPLKEQGNVAITALIEEIEKFQAHATRQIDQVRRRVLNGEKIPHDEKVFSCFEEHTEWITKGKAGVPQELGLRVSFLEDQHGFILTHRVMIGETDDKVAVPIVISAKKHFPNLNGCSFDKGYYSPANIESLEGVLEKLTMPQKGRPSKKRAEMERSEEFKARKRQHSAVESAINGLQNHGLDYCPDRGLDGFKRYVAMGVLARNIEKLGTKIQQTKRKQRKRKEKYNETYQANRKQAA